MRYSDAQQLFEQACEFPADHETVVEQLGNVELTAPTGDSIPIDRVLERTGESQYHSAEELYNTLFGNLDDAFVGRKYYDDRAGARSGVHPVRDSEQPSPSF